MRAIGCLRRLMVFCAVLPCVELCQFFFLNVATAQEPSPAESEEFEQTLFDLFTGDKIRGAILVEFRGTEFRIIEPNEVLNQVTEIRERDLVLPLLQGIVSGKRNIPEVGTVTFDENLFQVRLDLLPKFYPKAVERNPDRIEPYSEGEPGLSFISSADNGVTFGRDSQVSTQVLRSSLSWRNLSLLYTGVDTSNTGINTREASANAVLGRFLMSAGRLRSPVFTYSPFSANLEYTGIGIQSVDSIFTAADASRSSSIEVFIPSRSKVEIYADEKLLFNQILEFGTHQIDTAVFPQGAYLVDIVITDSSGSQTRESQYFASSGLLAVPGYPSLGIEFGRPRNGFNTFDHNYLQLRAAARVYKNVQLGGTYSTLGSDTLAGVDLTTVIGRSSYQIGYAAGDDSSSGYFGAINGIFEDGYSVGATYRKVVRDENTLRDSDELTPGFPALNDEDPRIFLFSGETQGRLLLRRTFGKVAVGLLGLENVRSNEDVQQAVGFKRGIGPDLNLQFNFGAGGFLIVNTNYLFTDEGPRAAIFASLQQSLFPWTFGSTVRQSAGAGPDAALGSIFANYQDFDFSGLGTAANIRSTFDSNQESSVGSRQAVFIDRTTLFEYGGGVSDTGGDNFTQNLRFGTALIVAPDGTATLSSTPRQSATLLVTVEGETGSGELDLMVNGSRYATLKIGTKTAIGILPFRRYRLALRSPLDKAGYEKKQKGAGLIKVDETVHEVTALPSAVIRRTWSAKRVFIAFGRILDQDQQPVANRRLGGVSEYSVTGEDGAFQAEIAQGDQLEIKLPDGNTCHIVLPEWDYKEASHNFGDLICGREENDSQSENPLDTEAEGSP